MRNLPCELSKIPEHFGAYNADEAALTPDQATNLFSNGSSASSNSASEASFSCAAFEMAVPRDVSAPHSPTVPSTCFLACSAQPALTYQNGSGSIGHGSGAASITSEQIWGAAVGDRYSSLPSADGMSESEPSRDPPIGDVGTHAMSCSSQTTCSISSISRCPA